MTATTALTAQNTQGVHDIHHTPPAFVRKQIDACIDDVGVDVVKTGKRTPVRIICMLQGSQAFPDSEKECWLLPKPFKSWPMPFADTM